MMHAAAVAAVRRAAVQAPRAAPRYARMFSTTMSVAEEAPVSPKISQIVDSIETLTLLEASELVQALKVRDPLTGDPPQHY